MVRIPTHRPPTHPGEMLLEEFLLPMGITQRPPKPIAATTTWRIGRIPVDHSRCQCYNPPKW